MPDNTDLGHAVIPFLCRTCLRSGKATRVGYKILDGGRKVRVARRSGETIDK